jgi:hypothetical protein
MAANPPYYDQVMWPGGDGIRVPTEVFGSEGRGTPGATIAVLKDVAHNYGAAHADWNLSPDETAGSVYSVTSANGAANAVFPAYIPGKIFVVNNGSGQAVTFKVTGKTGIAVANGKAAQLFMDPVALDVQRSNADTTPTV